MGVCTPASDPLSGTPQPLPSYPPQLLPPTGLEHGAPVPGLDGDTTKPRTLNGIQVSGEEADDLFQLYVQVTPMAHSNTDFTMQLLPVLCSIPSHSRPANAAEYIL